MGRGLVFIASAKVYFILTSYGIHFALPNLLDSPEAYGLYLTAMRATSILNNILIVATVQVVSKLVSENEGHAAATLRQGLKLQLAVGCALCVAVFAGAPLFAREALHDNAVAPLLRIACVVMWAYALYAALIGSLNGRRLFLRQAGLDATFSTLRTAGILGGAAVGVSLGAGALGAMSGFAGAAGCVLLVALLAVGVGQAGAGAPLKRWLALMAPLWAYHGFLNFMLMSDGLVLKGTVGALAVDAGMAPAEAAARASELVGYYGNAQNFAFVPYQLLLSLNFVIFPMVSRATAAGDEEAARRTIRIAIRFATLAVFSVAAPLSGASEGAMRLINAAYLPGAPALSILVLGVAAFALFVLTATIVSGAGRPAVAACIAATAAVAVVGVNYMLVRQVGVSERALVLTATGTSSVMVLALVAGATWVYRRFHALVPLVTVLRTAVASAAALGVARAMPQDDRLMALVALAAGFATYVLVLIALRELHRGDLDTVTGLLRARRRQ